MAPVVAGMWTHADLLGGAYTLDDLLDALEMLVVKAENEERAHEDAQRRR